MSESKTTPMMEQWQACKERSGDSILLFRLGDFYETFYEDAHILADNLDLTLTQRQGIPMSGIPASHVDTYIDRLVGKGFKVAVAEQFSNSESVGPIDRKVDRFITPGTLLSSSLLTDKKHNYIISISQTGSLFGFAILDLSTGIFSLGEHDNIEALTNELFLHNPSEILISNKFAKKHENLLKEFSFKLRSTLSSYVDWVFEHQFACGKLSNHFQVSSLDGFGLKGLIPAINAAGGLLSYIQDKLLLPIDHISIPKKHNKSDRLMIDSSSLTNLEVLESLHNGQNKSSLLSIMDHTLTPMGGRLLRNVLTSPFKNKEDIIVRQDAIEHFLLHSKLYNNLIEQLKQIRDIERLITKISSELASPKDLGSLKTSLKASLNITSQLIPSAPQFLIHKFQDIYTIQSVYKLLLESLNEELPLRAHDGSIFIDNYHPELARLRNLKKNAQEWILSYQDKLRTSYDIKKLKVCFNHSLGYYIEIHNNYTQNVPKEFIRRQSRLNHERFSTHELQAFEDEILSVEDKLQKLELQLFKAFCLQILDFKSQILQLSTDIADLDYIIALSKLALNQGYTKPIITDDNILVISKGRHPVLDKLLPHSEFIPNDIDMSSLTTQVMLITGPNMAGKSTFIRQTALLVIMAQMGSFIPASTAKIGIVDKIFTRIGAGDNLSKGMSTFMVEMAETANILNHATSSSLIILDEIGRGTSTYDGIAIAQAVLEYLLYTKGKQAKTLFATHYKELTTLDQISPNIKNFHAGIKNNHGSPVFLYTILPGSSQKSFGIHVAKLAGFPLSVISRAKQILCHMEGPENIKEEKHIEQSPCQLTLF